MRALLVHELERFEHRVLRCDSLLARFFMISSMNEEE